MAVLAAATRFFHPELTKVVFIDSVADTTLPQVPTLAEITGGTDISGDIAAWSGWSVTSSQIPTPDLASRFTSKIGGRTDAADSSITFYADVAGSDIRTLLPRGTTGYVLIADGGLTAGNHGDLFPVEVIALPKERDIDSAAARIVVSFSITEEPSENIVIPAA